MLRCSRTLSIVAAIAGFGFFGSAPAEAGHRIAVVVGNNQGGPGRPALAYAERDAQRMQSTLQELGNVDAVHLLLGLPAVDLAQAFDKIQPQIAARHGETTVLFYYSGHADGAALLLGDSRLPFRQLRSRLKALGARLFVAIIDACQSGAAARAKGGLAVSTENIQIIDPTDVYQGGVFLSSSAPGELSHESDELQASFFTHALISGLRGAADTSNDARVSLEEAYRFAYHATVSQTQGILQGIQHPTVDVQVHGRGQLVLTWLKSRQAYLVLPEDMHGQYRVRGHEASGPVAEVLKTRGHRMRLALAPGRYEVGVRRGDALWSQSVHLVRGQSTPASDAKMRRQPTLTVAQKGPQTRRHSLLLGYQLSSGYLRDATAMHGLRANYSWRWRALNLGMAASYGHSRYVRRDDIQVSLHQIGLGPSADLRWPLIDSLDLLLGVDLQAAWVRQQGRRDDGARQTLRAFALPLSLRAGLGLKLNAALSAEVLARIGVTPFYAQDALHIPVMAGVEVGLRYGL